MARTPSITKFTNSLKDYLINAMSNKVNDIRSLEQRYNNMKVFMDPSAIDEPHFYVSVGISEVCFSIKTQTKIDGSVGMEDIYVKRWAERHNIHMELEKFYKDLKEALRKESTMSEEERSKQNVTSVKQVIARGNRTENEDELKVDMTSTGLNRAKHILEEDKRKKRLLHFKKDIVKKDTPEKKEQNNQDKKD